jgi:hypothetical protein
MVGDVLARVRTRRLVIIRAFSRVDSQLFVIELVQYLEEH